MKNRLAPKLLVTAAAPANCAMGARYAALPARARASHKSGQTCCLAGATWV